MAVLEAGRYAKDAGFDASDCACITTAVSELARNVVKYAGRGEAVFKPTRDGIRTGLEITVQDRGPGMDDVEEALKDHYSTGGTLGLGLPGVRRLMDDFEVESVPGRGTRVVVRKWLT
jgi:serine/threonine-protein kinase RsbT